jgi:DUF1009 family protein
MLGLIAGQGGLPVEIARAARRAGRPVAAIALRDFASPELASLCSSIHWLAPGAIANALAALSASGAKEVVLAGKVPKGALFATEAAAALALDARAESELAALPDRRDASILLRVVSGLEALGLRVLPQAELVPELLAGEGPLAGPAPTPQQLRDIGAGFPIARALAAADVGQTLVLHSGSVLAVEAIEGSDEAIRRGGRYARGATVLKVARPDQDPRFDLPAIGPDTLDALCEVGARCLAVEAGRTLLIDRERLCARAGESGIALVGVVVGTQGERDARQPA